MELINLAILVAVSILIGLLAKGRTRTGFLLALSVWTIFWFQPASRITNLHFWLPIATLLAVIASWTAVTPFGPMSWSENWKSVLIIAGVVVLWILLHYLDMEISKGLDVSARSLFGLAIIGLAILTVAGLLSRYSRSVLLWSILVLILVLFVVIKTPPLTVLASSILRGWTGQSPRWALAIDMRWLGFSYIAFRVIHTIRDSQSGRMPAVTLGEYVTYTIFYPALSAGPIDRIERFIKDLRAPLVLSDSDWLFAGQRIFLGMFKKYVLADGLALVALSSADAASVQSGMWTWLALYAYSFQIFFDFSGYTDIAIGLGRLVGISLPENFTSPYLKPNITQFWNSWHITLAQWFRAYYFNPLMRALRSGQKLPLWIIVLIMQISTMLLIGLWHGVTWNFALWGLWHGIGLFIHNRWNEFARVRVLNWATTPLRKNLVHLSGVFFTFNFISIGWIFFSMPTLPLTWVVLVKLVGWPG